MEEEEVRWELGERVMARSAYVAGGFILVYAVVMGWKHLVRQPRRFSRWLGERRRLKSYNVEIKALKAAQSEADILRRTYSRPTVEPPRRLLPPPAKALPPPRDTTAPH